MKHYTLKFLPSAVKDIDDLGLFISVECSSPLTALRWFEDLEKYWDWLERYAELPAVHTELSIQYEKVIRCLYFKKKMAIVYSVENDIVIIHRILSQSMIIF